MADNTINDELLDKHDKLNELLSKEYSLSEDILTANNLNNSELENSILNHEQINEKVSEEESLEKSIIDIHKEGNQKLVEKFDLKKDILFKTEEEINLEDAVLGELFRQRMALDDILDRKNKLTQSIIDGRNEEEKLLGFSKNIIDALKAALAVQQQLNAAIAAGASSGGSGGGNGAGNGGGGNNGGGNSGSGNGGNNGNGGNSGNGNTTDNLKPSTFGKFASNAFNSSVSYLKTLGTEIFHKWVEIDKQVFTTSRKMGMTFNQMENFRKNITANYGEMANRLGMTFEEIFKFQQSYIQQTGKSIVLTNKQVESFAGLSKIVGESAVNDMAKNMDDFGASSQTAIDNLTLNLARAANQGLNVEETASKFAKNIKLASQYTFRNGIDGISKMTLMSQRLKFNMESIAQAMDKFSTIEGAISSSANLQVLGGAYAMNFSNPLVAMGEALIDGEGFTKRIIDTVSRTAMFNANTGVVEMSPIEKTKMREAAKITGINYDELWNMASQNAKLSNIERYIGGKGFTEEQKTFLANTAQYDAKTREWYVNRMGKNGEEKVAISRISNSEELSEIQRSNDFEKSIQGDVHSIREKLDEYLQNYVRESKTFEETFKGQKERVLIDFSDTANSILGEIKETLKGMSKAAFMASGILFSIGGFLLGKGVGAIGDALKGIPGGGGGGVGRGIGRGIGRAIGRGALRYIPGMVTIADVAISGVKAYDANEEHNERVKVINEDNSLSEEDKRQAINESERERNKSVGTNIGKGIGAIGGHVVGRMVGRKIGAAIGSIGGPIGSLVGMGIGHVLGGFVGNWIGEKVSPSAEPSTNTVINNNTTAKANNATATASTKVSTVVENIPNSNELAMASDIHSIKRAVEAMSVKDGGNKSVSYSSVKKNVRKDNRNTNTTQIDNVSSNTVNHDNNVLANYVNEKSYIASKNVMMNSNILSDNRNMANVGSFDYTPSITPIKQYDKKTYVREVNVPQTNYMAQTNRMTDRIDINVSGTLRLQGDGKTKNIDINEVFKSPEFQRMLIAKINEGFSKGGNAVQSRSLDTTQAIMGGYYTPNYLNSKV